MLEYFFLIPYTFFIQELRVYIPLSARSLHVDWWEFSCDNGRRVPDSISAGIVYFWFLSSGQKFNRLVYGNREAERCSGEDEIWQVTREDGWWRCSMNMSMSNVTAGSAPGCWAGIPTRIHRHFTGYKRDGKNISASNAPKMISRTVYTHEDLWAYFIISSEAQQVGKRAINSHLWDFMSDILKCPSEFIRN